MKIGIITLHRLINYGSALQAYALQKYIEQNINKDVEIIDYIYPNKDYRVHKSFYKWCRGIVRTFLDYTKRHKIRGLRKFRDFRKDFFKLSKSYKDDEELLSAQPKYDLYITGSDQVWNVNTLRNNPIMYCMFAPDGAKIISFSASFGTNTLPDRFKGVIRERLNRYKYIGVREKNSLKILEDLQLNCSIKKFFTCDPTLLLSANDYVDIVSKSELNIEDDFILVYKLDYSFSADPALTIVADYAAEYFGCRIIHIGHHKFHYSHNCEYVTGIGPSDFLYLFNHAKYIVSSSFHGTMFSIIYRKPFTSILPKDDNSDCRIQDILEQIGLNENGIRCNNRTPNIITDNPFNDELNDKLQKYIELSKKELTQAIYN